jgi:hypothetical protein
MQRQEQVPMQLLEVGSHIKFKIAHAVIDGIEGEWPWGEVVGMVHDRRIRVRVGNELVSSDVHGIFYGDVLELEMIYLEPDLPPIWQSVGKALPEGEGFRA